MSVDEYRLVPGRLRIALWQLLVFLERGLSGNKERRPGCLGGAEGTDRASVPGRLAPFQGCTSNPVWESHFFEPA